MKNNITTAAALMGSTKSEAKTIAARSNGVKGGRPADPFKAALREAGVKWAWTANGLLKFYLRSGQPQRMKDGSFWNGTETIGEYSSWEQAKTCGWLASHAE
jgi:hypothetical protein